MLFSLILQNFDLFIDFLQLMKGLQMNIFKLPIKVIDDYYPIYYIYYVK